jgi:plasmid stabilization system protein ParE
MNRFVLAPDADLDLDDIWEYIAIDSLDAADRFIEKLHGQIQALAATPRMGHRRADLAEDRPLLFWPVGNYLIIYRALAEWIEIVAIVHGKRDIPRFLQRRRI